MLQSCGDVDSVVEQELLADPLWEVSYWNDGLR